MTTVLVFGAFDVIHPGHVSFLSQAREHGDRLIAAVARDRYIIEQKGRLPIHDEERRRLGVLETGLVDEALLGDETPGTYSVVATARPQVICVGYDQELFKENLVAWIAASGAKITVVTLKPYQPERFKSSKLNAGSYKYVGRRPSHP